MLKTYLATQMSWNFPLLFFLISLSIFYSFICMLLRKKTIPPIQPILFFTGIILLFTLVGSPLLSISYLSFSLHMIQMSIIFFIVPPLLLLGIPKVEMNSNRFTKMIHTLYLRPLYALIAFAILFLLYHFPIIFTFLSQDSFWQKTYLLVLFILAIFMWAPIATNWRKKDTMNQQKFKKLSSLLIMPACVFFMISALMQNMNNSYMSDIAAVICFPADYFQILPSPFNTKYDQMASGIFMISIHKLGIVVTSKLHDYV